MCNGCIGFFHCFSYVEILVLSSGEVSVWKTICIFFPLSLFFSSYAHTRTHIIMYILIYYFLYDPYVYRLLNAHYTTHKYTGYNNMSASVFEFVFPVLKSYAVYTVFTQIP